MCGGSTKGSIVAGLGKSPTRSANTMRGSVLFPGAALGAAFSVQVRTLHWRCPPGLQLKQSWVFCLPGSPAPRHPCRVSVQRVSGSVRRPRKPLSCGRKPSSGLLLFCLSGCFLACPLLRGIVFASGGPVCLLRAGIPEREGASGPRHTDAALP